MKYDPFSADGLTQGKLTLIAGNTAFSALTGIRDYSMALVQTASSLSEQSVEQIRQLVPQGCAIHDIRDRKTSGTYQTFIFCVLTFLGVILLVSALNIMNCLSMSVSSLCAMERSMAGCAFRDILPSWNCAPGRA